MPPRLPEPRIATFSICATDGRDWGVAVASKFLAVGSAVPAAAAGLGAIATQALANTSYRELGLELLRSGAGAGEVVERLTAADEGRDHRQLGVVDGRGGSATYTGAACFDWAGGRTGEGVACQGNILSGPEVVDALLATYTAGSGALVDRLLRALEAGDQAGGDRRGRQSAAVLVVRRDGGYGGFDDRMIELRVDDHPRPIPELARLVRLWRVYFEVAAPEEMLPLDADMLRRVATALERRGRAPADGSREATVAALEAWAGVENLEERCGRSDLIDPVVLEMLEAAD